MDQYIQGSSIALEITLTDEAGSAENLDNILTASVKIYQQKTSTVIYEGTLVDGKVVKSSTASSGKINLYIPGATIDAATAAKYNYYVIVTKSDVRFASGTWYGVQVGEAFEIKAKPTLT